MVHSFKVLTTLAAQRVVGQCTGTANTVIYPAAAASNMIGITLDTVVDTMGSIPVACAGEIAYLYFNDSVNAGELVSADTSGRGVPYVAASVGAFYVGVLLDAKVEDTGAVAQVLIQPGVGYSA